MITITLNQIRNASPCSSGWKKVLKAHEHLGMDTPFPLSSVIESNNIADTLWCFNALDDLYVLKKFAILCAKEVLHLMTDPRSATAIEVAERYLDGNASAEEMCDADAAAAAAAAAVYAARAAARAARAAARAARAVYADAADAAADAAVYAADAAADAAVYAADAAAAAAVYAAHTKQKQILKALLDA